MVHRRRLAHLSYQLVKSALFRIDPEVAHVTVMTLLGALQKVPGARRMIHAVMGVDDPILSQHVFGVRFPSPLGLAAGFDKDATALDLWHSFGFGFAELGTVTASPQPGNPQPRLYRLVEDSALLNRMGFNNEGARKVAERLKARRTQDIIGINIGKTKVVPLEQALEDYRTSARLMGDLADYLVVNVSSPNTPGLRDLQAVESLRPILQAVQEETSTPVLVKIAPDLSNDDIDEIADLACQLKLAGIVATNTTISREHLTTDTSEMGAGGVSGPPEAERSLDVLRRLYQRVDNELVLISVGGIETAEQAWERIVSGATLLQGFTALIYQGPEWIREVQLGIAEQLRKQGLDHIKEAIGSGRHWIS